MQDDTQKPAEDTGAVDDDQGDQPVVEADATVEGKDDEGGDVKVEEDVKVEGDQPVVEEDVKVEGEPAEGDKSGEVNVEETDTVTETPAGEDKPEGEAPAA